MYTLFSNLIKECEIKYDLLRRFFYKLKTPTVKRSFYRKIRWR